MSCLMPAMVPKKAPTASRTLSRPRIGAALPNWNRTSGARKLTYRSRSKASEASKSRVLKFVAMVVVMGTPPAYGERVASSPQGTASAGDETSEFGRSAVREGDAHHTYAITDIIGFKGLRRRRRGGARRSPPNG